MSTIGACSAFRLVFRSMTSVYVQSKTGPRLVSPSVYVWSTFGLRSVYFWSAFGLPPAIVQYTYDLRSVYVMILIPLFLQATSNLRSIYINLRCLRSVYILSTYVFEQFFCASFVFLCAQRPVHVRSTSGVRFAFRSIYVWPTFGLRQDNIG